VTSQLRASESSSCYTGNGEIATQLVEILFLILIENKLFYRIKEESDKPTVLGEAEMR
jgi:hypothetical protein